MLREEIFNINFNIIFNFVYSIFQTLWILPGNTDTAIDRKKFKTDTCVYEYK